MTLTARTSVLENCDAARHEKEIIAEADEVNETAFSSMVYESSTR